VVVTTMSCTELVDVADELALGALPGDVRALALHHLEACAPCRATVEALCETADQLLFANAAVEPPSGFEDRVLARLAAERPAPRRRPRRALALVAAAAALLTLVGGVFTVAGHTAKPHATAAATDHELRTVQLISATGQVVGDVSAYPGPSAWFFMRVEQGIAPGAYHCVLDVADRPPVTIGSLTVADGHGAWGQDLAVDAAQVHTARLVDSGGATIATASFE